MAGSMSVTRKELAAYLSSYMTPDIAKLTVDKLIHQLSWCLAAGYRIELRGFGTFEPVTRKGAENRRNPKTGEAVEKKADRKTVKFRLSKSLEKEMNRCQENT